MNNDEDKLDLEDLLDQHYANLIPYYDDDDIADKPEYPDAVHDTSEERYITGELQMLYDNGVTSITQDELNTIIESYDAEEAYEIDELYIKHTSSSLDDTNDDLDQDEDYGLSDDMWDDDL